MKTYSSSGSAGLRRGVFKVLAPSLLGICMAVGTASRAATVAEWQFNDTQDIASGAVKLNTVNAGASAESILMAKTTVSAAATGLGDRWKPFLQTGFLNVDKGGGEANENKHGLTTGTVPSSGPTSYRAYMGFGGLGAGASADGAQNGGTIYMVASPKAEGWGVSQGRFGLMGTGHTIEGSVWLQVTKTGELQLYVGGKASAVAVSIPQQWKPGTWYFIAASWRAAQKPVLYVREMSPAGASASPAAVQKTAEKEAPAVEQPKGDPITLGAVWLNTGGKAVTSNGANAKFAYARLDNIYSTGSQMEAVFNSLAAQ